MLYDWSFANSVPHKHIKNSKVHTIAWQANWQITIELKIFEKGA